MVYKRQIVATTMLFLGLILWSAEAPAAAWAGDQGTTVSSNPGPSPDQLNALIARCVENQHKSDRAMEEFERVERKITRKGEGPEVVSDFTQRLVPSGNGVIKLPMAQNGMPVSPDAYRAELQYAIRALEIAIHPSDRYKQDLVKFEKRRHDRKDFVDTSAKAFRITWAGRESRGSATLAKLLLEPDPNYRPNSHLAVTFQHVHAVLWVDEAQGQFARIEGNITSDVTFVGGIAGKIYQGGHFMMEQSEVTPGVWLPTVYTYDVEGRKFLFGFGVHERTEITRYRHVGPPAQAIEVIRGELNNLTAETPFR